MIFITGDLVHEGHAEDYRHLKTLLDEETGDTPYYITLGNHDRHAAFWEGYMGKPGKNAPYYYSSEQDGFRIIGLDTSPEDGCLIGELDQEQLDFLKNELKTTAPQGSIIIMHHPIDCIYESFAGHMVKNGANFFDIVQNSDVRLVLTGHTHFTSFNASGNILFSTASGSAFGMDISSSKTISFTDSSTYLTGRMTNSKAFVGQVEMTREETTLFSLDAHILLNMMTAH